MERLAKIVGTLVKRWTSHSPKAARIATDVGMVIGVVGSVALALPTFGLSIPAWSIPAAGFAIALSGKLTTMDDAKAVNKAIDKINNKPK